jgi:hypothetical protein
VTVPQTIRGLLLVGYCLTTPLSAQISLFNLATLDSLQPGILKGNTSMHANWNKTTTHNVVLFSDLNFLFPLPQHAFEFNGNLILNTIEERLATNRYFMHIRGDLWKFEDRDGALHTRRFFPEIFLLQAFDYGRGLNFRWQTGLNGVVAFKRNGAWRLTGGAGFVTEYENWRIAGRGALPTNIVVPAGTYDYLNGQKALDRNGNIRIESIRSNFFLHFVGKVNMVHVNAFTSVQVPFQPPFDNLPIAENLPLNDKIYPRYTLELAMSIPVIKKLNLQTRLSLQHDQGQPSLLVPKSVFTLAQGVAYTF